MYIQRGTLKSHCIPISSMVSAVGLFDDRDTARKFVPTLKQKPTEDSNLSRRLSICVWSLMDRGWPTAGGQTTAIQWRLWNRLCYVAFLSQRQTMSCHVMSHIIPHHSRSAISHIICGHCTYCVSCHTVRDEDAIITGLLLLLFTDYFTECYCSRLSKVSKAPVHPRSGYF